MTIRPPAGGLTQAVADATYLAATALDDTAYDATSWNGDTTHAPTKNAVRDKIESLSSGGGLLAQTHYKAGSDTATFNTTSTSFVDVDATNLAVTFTAPASGKVLVRLTAVCQNNDGSLIAYAALREGSTNIGSQLYLLGFTSAAVVPMSVPFLVTGLTPGNSYTYKWAWRVTAGTTYMFTGPGYGACTMEVIAAA